LGFRHSSFSSALRFVTRKANLEVKIIFIHVLCVYHIEQIMPEWSTQHTLGKKTLLNRINSARMPLASPSEFRTPHSEFPLSAFRFPNFRIPHSAFPRPALTPIHLALNYEKATTGRCGRVFQPRASQFAPDLTSDRGFCDDVVTKNRKNLS
jgi:hypothetical protein